METGGIIDIELYEDIAPITCENFKKLVSEGFYDGLIFHRVIAGFMIQGGDPTGTGCGGSDKNIKGEFMLNGVQNSISHVRGVISMARSQSYNSASSQFFICHADAKFLDGQYAGFGKVVSGLEVVDEIAGVKTDFRDRPIVDMRMKKVMLVD
jgi:peptidyl-prolyl cis-trans isomerase B (cyclophilin B)